MTMMLLKMRTLYKYRSLHGLFSPRHAHAPAASPITRRSLHTPPPYNYRRRYDLEQMAKAKSHARLILLGILAGVIGTVIRIKLMAANPPPPPPINAANSRHHPVPVPGTKTKSSSSTSSSSSSDSI